jgi:hypothetical protein
MSKGVELVFFKKNTLAWFKGPNYIIMGILASKLDFYGVKMR